MTHVYDNPNKPNKPIKPYRLRSMGRFPYVDLSADDDVQAAMRNTPGLGEYPSLITLKTPITLP